MADKMDQIRAVDGWVGEAGAGAVAVGVEATTADLPDRTCPACSAQSSLSELPGRHPGKQECLVESVAVHMQAGLRRPVIRDLKGVSLLNSPVGLDD